MTSASLSDAPWVDSHVHVFRRNMPLIPDPRHSPDYEFTAEQLQSTLDEHGVRHCVIAAASPWGDCNDYIIESLRAHPGSYRLATLKTRRSTCLGTSRPSSTVGCVESATVSCAT